MDLWDRLGSGQSREATGRLGWMLCVLSRGQSPGPSPAGLPTGRRLRGPPRFHAQCGWWRDTGPCGWRTRPPPCCTSADHPVPSLVGLSPPSQQASPSPRAETSWLPPPRWGAHYLQGLPWLREVPWEPRVSGGNPTLLVGCSQAQGPKARLPGVREGTADLGFQAAPAGHPTSSLRSVQTPLRGPPLTRNPKSRRERRMGPVQAEAPGRADRGERGVGAV